MQLRTLSLREQPHVLHAGLKGASIDSPILLDDESSATGTKKQQSEPEHVGVFARLLSWIGGRKAAPKSMPATTPRAMGLPHDVFDVEVTAENVRFETVDGQTLVYFCPSHNYIINGRTLQGGDDKEYPPLSNTRIALECEAPADGHHPVTMRVSNNGYLDVKIMHVGKQRELASV